MRSKTADIAHILLDALDNASDVYLQHIKDVKAEQAALWDYTLDKLHRGYSVRLEVVKDGVVKVDVYEATSKPSDPTREEEISRKLHEAHLKIMGLDDDE